jgi:hypothetical protein
MWINIISPNLQRQGVEVSSIGQWSPTYQGTGNERDNSVADVLFGSVSYVGPSGPAQLETTIAGINAWGPPPDQLCSRFRITDGTCNATKRSDGSMVVAVQCPANKSGYSGEPSVYHYRLDGSVVGMTSRPQYVEANTSDSARVLLSVDQLTDLATIGAIALPH